MILIKYKRNHFKVLLPVFLLVASVAAAQSEETQKKDQAGHRAAFEECRTTLGIEKPAQGQRPQAMDESVREQLEACMLEKGFDPPKFRGGPAPDGERPPRGDRGGGSGGAR